MVRKRPQAPFTTRAAMILLLSVLVAVVAGGLTYLNGHRVAEALVVAGVAAGASLGLFSNIIE
jgi:hypothetical protein